MDSKRWEFLLQGQQTLLSRAHQIVSDSFKLPSDRKDDACTSRWSACNATVNPEIEAGLWKSVLCAAAPVQHQSDPKVAFIGFDFHGDQLPLLQGVYFDGHVFSAYFEDPGHEEPVFSVASLGGSYLTGEPELGSTSGSRIELLPNCTQSVVQLPRIVQPASSTGVQNVDVILHGEGGRACKTNIGSDNAFAILLPVPKRSGQASSLDVQMSTEPTGLSQFRTAWAGQVPPATMEATPTQLGFSWAPHCLFPHAICPTVELPDVGGRCKGTRTVVSDGSDLCVYRNCRVGSTIGSSGVKLPLSALFRADDMSWPDHIVAVNQTLHGFVPPDQYQIEVDARQWQHQPHGDDVGWISITTPDGSERRIELGSRTPRAQYKVAVPHVSCSDNLIAQAYGERRYDQKSLPIAGDHVLDGPAATAHVLAFGVDGAFTWILPLATNGFRTETPPPNVYLASHSARPVFSNYVGGELGGWIALRPPTSATEYELRGDFLYSDRRAFGPDQQSLKVAYYRAPLVLTVGHSLGGRLWVGVGGGILLGGPFYTTSEGFPHGDIASVLVAYLRFKIGRDFALEARGSAFVGEAQPVYDTDLMGGVLKQSGELTSLAISLGTRWDIASGVVNWAGP